MDEFINPFKGEVVEDNSPMRTERGPEHGVRRKKILVVLGILLVLGLTTAAFTARPAYRAVKLWRSERLLIEAEELRSQKQWQQAASKAQAAYVLAPTNTNLRFIAKLCTEIGAEDALTFWMQLVARDGTSVSDRRALIAQAMRMQRDKLAVEQAELLLAMGVPSKEDLLLAAEVAQTSGDQAKELLILRDATSRYPDEPEIRFRLNRVLLFAGDVSESRNALTAILADMYRTDKMGLDALRVVAALPGPVFPERAELARLSRQHPLATTEDLVRATQLDIQAQPAASAAFIEKLIASVQGGNARAVATVADWLLHLNQFQRILTLITDKEAKRDIVLNVIRADALSLLGQTEELEETLSEKLSQVPEEYAMFYRWQSAFISKSPPANERDVRAAIEKAAANPAALIFFAPRLEMLGRDDLAAQVYTKLRGRIAHQKSARAALMKIARRQDDTKELLRLITPTDKAEALGADARNDISYLQLLLDRDVDQNRSIALELVAAEPSRLVFRSTLALAYLKSGDQDSALKTFADLEFDWQKASNSIKAVYAAVLLAQGSAQKAGPIIQHLEKSKLLPEEKALFGKKP